MKKFTCVFVMMAIVAALALAGGSSDKGQTTSNIKYAHTGLLPETQTRYAQEFADLVKEKSNGRVSITVYPASQLGTSNEQLDGIKSGAIEMGHHVFSQLGKYYPDILVLNAPYVFRDGEHAMKVSNPNTSPVLQKMNEELVKRANLRIIGSHYRGTRELSVKFPVYSPADLKGHKIRGIANEVWQSMVKGMGAIPTTVEMKHRGASSAVSSFARYWIIWHGSYPSKFQKPLPACVKFVTAGASSKLVP